MFLYGRCVASHKCCCSKDVETFTECFSLQGTFSLASRHNRKESQSRRRESGRRERGLGFKMHGVDLGGMNEVL